jgi:hypothetical protein
LPLVYEGEALFHIARFHRVAVVAEQLEAQQQLEPEPHFDDEAY